MCNYSCWYCPDYLHDGKLGFPNLEKCLEFFNDLQEQHPNKILKIELNGGEPSIWPELGKFAEWCKANDNQIILTTNGSRTMRWWKKYYRMF